jgi:hypothetical protein
VGDTRRFGLGAAGLHELLLPRHKHHHREVRPRDPHPPLRHGAGRGQLRPARRGRLARAVRRVVRLAVRYNGRRRRVRLPEPGGVGRRQHRRLDPGGPRWPGRRHRRRERPRSLDTAPQRETARQPRRG